MRRLFIIGGIALVVLGVFNVRASHWDLATKQPPVDFELNWVAGHRLAQREPLYDRAASRRDGLRLMGADFEYLDGATYTSFIGTPATALLYLPYTALSRDRAVDVWRVTEFLLMVAAIVVTGFALPRRSRLPAWLVGLGALCFSFPAGQSIGLGQVDGWVMLALAIGLWGVARERWAVAGGALGIATLLKISPGLLLVYLVLRGCRKVVLPALVSAGTVLAVAMAVGRPGDLFTWFRDVLPEVSKGGLAINNQSLPGWAAHLFGSDPGWLSYETGLGAWRWLSVLVMVGGVAAVLVLRRHRPLVVLELGAVVLVALLAGPVSWDHYSSWAVLVLVVLADVRWWEHRRMIERAALLGVLAVGSVLMRTWTLYPTPEQVMADWTRRIQAGTKTMGLLAYLAVVLWLLWRVPDPDATTGTAASEGSGEGAARRLAADGSESEGLHARG